MICLAAVTADVAVAVEDAHPQDTPNSTLIKEMWMTSSRCCCCCSVAAVATHLHSLRGDEIPTSTFYIDSVGMSTCTLRKMVALISPSPKRHIFTF